MLKLQKNPKVSGIGGWVHPDPAEKFLSFITERERESNMADDSLG